MTRKPVEVPEEELDAEFDEELDTADASPSLFPEGTYNFNTLSAERRTTQKGDPQLMVKFGLVSVVNGEDLEEGKVLVAFFPLTGGGKFKTSQLGVACGFDGRFKPSQLIEAIEEGRQLTITVSHREYNERTFVDLKSITPVGGTTTKAEVSATKAKGGKPKV